MADRIVMNDQERLNFYSFLAAPHGNRDAAIQIAFMSITPKLIKRHPKRVREFLADAHSRGIRVDFLTGDPLWALTMKSPQGPPYNQMAMTILNDVIAFNEAGSANQRFDAFQQDTEPYILKTPLDWDDDEDRVKIWNQYIESLTQWSQRIKRHNLAQDRKSRLLFGIAIPLWWETGVTPPANHRQVQPLVDYIAIMNYDTRNPVKNVDDEIKYASQHPGQTTVYVGFETLEVNWKDRTKGFFPLLYAYTASHYYLGNRALEKDIQRINKAFSSVPAFGGVAYHYYEPLDDKDPHRETAYRSLEPTPSNQSPACLLRGLAPNLNIGDRFTIRYVAIDQDNDPLTITMAISSDKGRTWTTLPDKDADGNPLSTNDGVYVLNTINLRKNIPYHLRITATETTTKQPLSGFDISDGSFRVGAKSTVRVAPATLDVSVEPRYPTPGSQVHVSWRPSASVSNGYYFGNASAPPLAFTTAHSGRVQFDKVGSHEVTVAQVDVNGNTIAPTTVPIQVYPDRDGDHVADVQDPDIDGDGIANTKERNTKDAYNPRRYPRGLDIGVWTFDRKNLKNKIRSGIQLSASGTPITFATHSKKHVLQLAHGSQSTHLAVSEIDKPTSALTIQMWIKPESAESIAYIPIFFLGELDQGFSLFLKDHSNRISLRSYSKQQFKPLGVYAGRTLSNNALFDGNWHHLAFTYNGHDKILKLYIDRQLVAQMKGKNIPAQLEAPISIRLFDARSKYDDQNRAKKRMDNSGQLANNTHQKDWENNTRYLGLVDDIKITRAALSASLLGEH